MKSTLFYLICDIRKSEETEVKHTERRKETAEIERGTHY